MVREEQKVKEGHDRVALRRYNRMESEDERKRSSRPWFCGNHESQLPEQTSDRPYSKKLLCKQNTTD